MVVHKVGLQERNTDFSYWQQQPYEARLAVVEEIRREYHAWLDSQQKGSINVQPGFQRVYRIIKR
jgi:hypothetical protein